MKDPHELDSFGSTVEQQYYPYLRQMQAEAEMERMVELFKSQDSESLQGAINGTAIDSRIKGGELADGARFHVYNYEPAHENVRDPGNHLIARHKEDRKLAGAVFSSIAEDYPKRVALSYYFNSYGRSFDAPPFTILDFQRCNNCSQDEAIAAITFLIQSKVVTRSKPGLFKFTATGGIIANESYDGRKALCDYAAEPYPNRRPRVETSLDFDFTLNIPPASFYRVLKYLELEPKGNCWGPRKIFNSLAEESDIAVGKPYPQANFAFSVWFAPNPAALSTDSLLSVLTQSPGCRLHYPRAYRYFLNQAALDTLPTVVEELKAEFSKKFSSLIVDNNSSTHRVAFLSKLF